MENNLFNFHKTDRFDKFSYNKAKPLVEFTLKHLDFLPCLCDSLTSFYSYDSINEIGRGGINKFKKFLASIDFKDERNNEFINEFEETLRDAYNVKSKYPSDSDDVIQDKLGKIRGVILELLIESFVKPRYEATRIKPHILFCTGCKVELNDKELITSDRISVDIAGWDGNNGEFYETKVGPQNFDEDVLSLLSLIKNELDKQKINSVVGCVTMATKDKLIWSIGDIKSKVDIKLNDDIKIYGKYELAQLIYSPFECYA